MPTPQLKKANQPTEEVQKICLFAQTNYRNQMRRFGIKVDDRRRHMYVIGKTGMGKTTMLENMVLHDIYNGHGLGIVDPHGDFAEKIVDYIPSHRINDVVYINPSDVEYPIGFNILEVENEEQKHLVAAGLMGIFKKIWPDVWSSRMEYILNNTLLALLDYPGSTLLGINRMLSDKKYRKRVVSKLTDPVIKSFWQTEFASWEDRYRKEAVAPIQNKIGQFLSASVIRNMVAQVKSTINIREAMDSRKIVIMNLSKGRIGEDNSRLLGGMLITKIQLAAMERVDTPEKDRQDFFLYVDEFQNFATQSFANILSEARKYRLSLIMAHQYVAQLTEEVRDAVFGNVGTIVSFRVGAADALLLAAEYAPTFTEEDLVNLSKYNIFLKLMIDGVASQPFSAATMPPIGHPTGNAEKVIRVSRERYAKKREEIEDKITRWSGMGGGDEDDEQEEEKPKPKQKEKRSSDKNQQKKESEAKKSSQETEQNGSNSEGALQTPQQPEQKSEHTDTVQKDSVSDAVETISLSSLLAVPSADQGETQNSSEMKRSEEKSSSSQEQGHDLQVGSRAEENSMQERSDNTQKSVEDSKDEQKDIKSSPNQLQEDGEQQKKKKRRRKRKKKKKNNTNNQDQSTQEKDQAKQQNRTEEQKHISKPEDTTPDKSSNTNIIQPDEIVRFTD